MRYIEFKEKLRGFTVFSISDIRRINKNFYRRRLNEWQEKGYIVKIIKGYYVFSDLEINEKTLFEIANRIYSPSYVSFQMALSYYGLIPESVYGVTCASSRRTYRFKTKIAEFVYRTIKPSLFFGYEIVRYDGKCFKMAAPEKAVLDYFYINNSLKTDDDYAGLRINQENFMKIVDKKKLLRYLAKYNQRLLTKRVKNFLEYIKNV